MKGYIFTKIQSFDRYHSRANSYGMVNHWRVETEDGYLVGIENTKKEALALARWHRNRNKR